MPQLDKYIFFNQIMTLFFFFFIIYRYLFLKALPFFARSLKFRFKRIARIKRQKIKDRELYKDSTQNLLELCVKSVNDLTEGFLKDCKTAAYHNKVFHWTDLIIFSSVKFALTENNNEFWNGYLVKSKNNLTLSFISKFIKIKSFFNEPNFSSENEKLEDLRFLK